MCIQQVLCFLRYCKDKTKQKKLSVKKRLLNEEQRFFSTACVWNCCIGSGGDTARSSTRTVLLLCWILQAQQAWARINFENFCTNINSYRSIDTVSENVVSDTQGEKIAFCTFKYFLYVKYVSCRLFSLFYVSLLFCFPAEH